MYTIFIVGFSNSGQLTSVKKSFSTMESAIGHWNGHIRRDPVYPDTQDITVVDAYIVDENPVKLVEMRSCTYDRRELEAALRVFKSAYQRRYVMALRRLLPIIMANSLVDETFHGERGAGFRYKNDAYALHNDVDCVLYKTREDRFSRWEKSSSINHYTTKRLI